MKKKASADDGASVFCRMTSDERTLLDGAIAIRQEQNPEATYTIGKVMVVQAVKWAKEVHEDRLQTIVKEAVARMEPGKRYPLDELISPSNTYAREFEAALQKLVELNQLRKVETGVYVKAR